MSLRLDVGGRLRRLLSALMRAAGRLRGSDSPWERVTMPVPTGAFGAGSRRQFEHYFEGESSVRVGSVDEIVAWLGSCQYVSDVDLFNQRDLWLHPGAFEQLRRGDCEDFALWAWRKLDEIGIEAEFYVGRVVCGAAPEGDRYHAWVVYRVDETDFLFEPAAPGQRMIRPLEDVKDEYVPHFAVHRRLGTCAFAGCLLDSQHERRRSPDPTRAAS